jgi:hypothetical protein
MSNRHERRKAAATSAKKSANAATLDLYLDETLRRVRAEFEHTGEIPARFECVTDCESFDFFLNWPEDRGAKAAACAVLRDSFRRRGVNRYVFATEGWVGKTAGIAPTDDPARGECALVIAVERNGSRNWARAEIARNGEVATLGPWEVNGDVPRSWLAELLEDGHSDRSPKAESPPLAKLSALDFQNLVDEDPGQAAEFLDSGEIHDQLGDLMADLVQNDAGDDPQAIFMALESVLRSIVKEMGLQNSFGGFARCLRDHPDRFPMFSTVRDSLPSTEHYRSCKAVLRRFICEMREAGHTDSAILGAFINMYMRVGSQAIGSLNLAGRIEAWDPEHQVKLRQVGLRSSFELDDEEGIVFIALSADRYPIGVMGRRDAVGDLFVSRIIAFPEADFATAVNKIKQSGAVLILGSEAKEMLCKMEQVKGSHGGLTRLRKSGK